MDTNFTLQVLDGGFMNKDEAVVGTVCLVPLSTSITSGVWSCPQHLGWLIILIDGWAPPVPHCNDLSPPKLWPLVTCVHERNSKWTNVLRLTAFDLLKNNINLRNNVVDYYVIILYCFITKQDCGGLETIPVVIRWEGQYTRKSLQLITDEWIN